MNDIKNVMYKKKFIYYLKLLDLKANKRLTYFFANRCYFM